MDCDACNNLLLEYLYEELDEVSAFAMQRHIDACSACAEALERLSLGRRAARSVRLLDAPATSAALLAAIHAEASASRVHLVKGTTVAEGAPESPRSRVPRWLQRVGEVAMRRQVAMAAVFLLMIGFGLSYHQLQAPTRPLPTSDDPGLTVIPARPVSSGALESAAAPPRPVVERRTSPRATEHRAPTIARGSPAEVQPLPTPRPSPPPSASAGAFDETATEMSASAPSPSPGAQPNRPSGNHDLEQGPSLRQTDASPLLAQHGDAQPSAAPAVSGAERNLRDTYERGAETEAEGWRAFQQAGNAASERGQRGVAIDAWRRALAANPPSVERRAIALRLFTALNAEGRAAEAGEVQAQHLSRSNTGLDLEGQVPSSAPAASRAAPPSRPLPSRGVPVHRGRQASPTNDSFSDFGL